MLTDYASLRSPGDQPDLARAGQVRTTRTPTTSSIFQAIKTRTGTAQTTGRACPARSSWQRHGASLGLAWKAAAKSRWRRMSVAPEAREIHLHLTVQAGTTVHVTINGGELTVASDN